LHHHFQGDHIQDSIFLPFMNLDFEHKGWNKKRGLHHLHQGSLFFGQVKIPFSYQ